MNKRQIIYPLVAVLLVGMFMGVIALRSQRREVVSMASSSIGRDLITVTNSTHLVRMNPFFRTQLSQLLGAPTHVAAVLLGDEPPPDGDGLACSRLVLTNDAGQRLLIRLREADRSGMFEVLGFRNLTR